MAEKETWFAPNLQGKYLFEQLLAWSEAEKYDDDYLRLLIDYQRLCPASPNFDIFYAKYALYYKSYKVALEAAKKAEKVRRCSYEVWSILADCYKALGDKKNEVKYRGLGTCYGRPPAGFEFSPDEKERREELLIFEKACNYANHAPGVQHRFYFVGNEFKTTKDVFAFGEFLPVYGKKPNGIILRPLTRKMKPMMVRAISWAS